jgi:hypothetical protein
VKNFRSAAEETLRKISAAGVRQLVNGYNGWVAAVVLIGEAENVRKDQIDKVRAEFEAARERQFLKLGVDR